MTHGIWPVADVRLAEEELMAQLPDGALMQRAATGLATYCADRLGKVYGARVTLMVGAGNNGGDALYAGARLAARGARVTALLLTPERAHAGGLAAFTAAGGRVDRPDFVDADLIVDGILGIGGRDGLRPEAAEIAAAAAESAAPIVAVDVPSGVDSDTGAVDGAAIRADATVTFGCLKPGLVVGAGATHSGEIHLVDIGLGPQLPQPRLHLFDEPDIPTPHAGDDKYTRGVLGVMAGSASYTGAAVLTVGAALHAGAGMVRYAGAAPDQVRAHWPEAVIGTGRVQAWVVGPGLGTDDRARSQLDEVLAADVPVLIDADGITLYAKTPVRRSAPTVVTPHDREFARIAGDVGADRVGAARRAARELGATVLLKGNATIVADPDGTAYVNPTGTPWLAAAGTGDVLSGIIGALLANGLPPTHAAATGAYLHGLAGQLASSGDAPAPAGEVLRALPDAIRQVRQT